MTGTRASNTSTGHRRVVVGVDDSPGGRAAFAFAAQEAEMRSSRLYAVCAWAMPGGHTAHSAVPGPLREACLDESRETLERLAAEVLVDTPGVSCVLAVAEPLAARALVEPTKGADLVVVGSQGRSSLAGLLLGSVIAEVVHHAHRPVVVFGPSEAADVELDDRRHTGHR